MTSTTELAGVTGFGADYPNTIIKTSIKEFLNWGFLQAKAYTNVDTSSSDLYSNNHSTLRPVKDPNFADGKIWEAPRKNWVWESGLNSSPNQCSGVYVSGVFYLPNDATYGHYVDYPNGRIIFNSAISTSLPVKAKYSYKNIAFADADSVPFFQQIQTNSLRIDQEQFGYFGSGDWFRINDTRIQLPLVAIESVDRSSFKPYQLGGGIVATKEFLIHSVSEDGGNLSQKIADIISMQGGRGIYGIDTNKIAQDNKFPITPSGTIASGALTYPQMVASGVQDGGYRWGEMYIMDAEITNNQKLTEKVSLSTVRMEIEVILLSP